MRLRDERRGACAFLHELRASRDKSHGRSQSLRRSRSGVSARRRSGRTEGGRTCRTLGRLGPVTSGRLGRAATSRAIATRRFGPPVALALRHGSTAPSPHVRQRRRLAGALPRPRRRRLRGDAAAEELGRHESDPQGSGHRGQNREEDAAAVAGPPRSGRASRARRARPARGRRARPARSARAAPRATPARRVSTAPGRPSKRRRAEPPRPRSARHPVVGQSSRRASTPSPPTSSSKAAVGATVTCTLLNGGSEASATIRRPPVSRRSR